MGSYIKTKFILPVYLIAVANLVNSQDIQFSQFATSPLSLNPAMSGLFEGDIRFIGNFRRQWSDIALFKTFSASADLPLSRGIAPNDIIGSGLIFFNDVAGDGLLSSIKVSGSFSYAKSLVEGADQYLSIGFQGGFVQRKIDFSTLIFDAQFDGQQFISGFPPDVIHANNNITFIDMSVGALWYNLIDSRTNIYSGMALYHLSQSSQSFFYSNNDLLFIKLIVHGGVQLPISKKIDLLPGFIYLQQGPNQQLNFGAFAKFILKSGSKEKTAFYLGNWYRFGDAYIIITKMDYRNFSIGLSYDINVSRLSPASLYNGGPELSFSYIPEMQLFHKADKHKGKSINCPIF